MDYDEERPRRVERARRYLESKGRPKLVMMGVLSVTVVAGFLSSVAMVHLGVERMSVRYPLAVGVAYVSFIAMLWVWLQRQVIEVGQSKDLEPLAMTGAAAFAAAAMGQGVAEKDEEEQPPIPIPIPPTRRRTWGSGGGSGGIDDLGALVLLVLVAVVCTLIVSAYLVAVSPMLLAELLVDGALMGAMSRAFSPNPPPHWSRAVVRRTWLAAMITAIVFGLVGYGIEKVAPGARTLGEAWKSPAAHR